VIQPSIKFGRRDRESQAAELNTHGAYVNAFAPNFNVGAAVITKMQHGGVDVPGNKSNIH
jgi:hypothetical protein